MICFQVYLRSILVLERDEYVHASQRLEEVDGYIQRRNCAVKAKRGDLRFEASAIRAI
jgi:hypothetical protein